MADAYLFLGLPDAATCVLSPKESLPKARAAAERALAIDDSLAEGWTSLATIRWKEMDWAGAEEGYKRSLALNPNYSLTHRFYGIFLSSLGRYDEASRELRREAELDPLSPSSDAAFGFVDYLAGRTREAIERFKMSLERYAAFPLAWRRLGFALVRDGRYAEAVEALQQASKYSGDSPNARTALGYAYAMAGSRGDALSVCADMEALSARRYVSAYGIALIYVGLGETEQAFEWLERAFDERNAELGWLEVDPRLEPLREDARFRDLISRVGFPPSR
jgi:tetratricopeptide (TPR) repeat protein